MLNLSRLMAVFLCAGLVAGAGVLAPRSPADSSPDPPGLRPGLPRDAFSNAFNASASGNRQALWVAVTGRATNHGPVRIRLYRWTASAGWGESDTPAGADDVDTDVPISLVLAGGRVCIGFASTGTNHVQCLLGR